MAGDWMKIEKVTPGKPEVLQISEILGIHPTHAFGLCVKFWIWCDDQLHDGNARGVTNVTLDFLIGHTGFTNALVKVGWLRDRSGSLEVPHFDRHLSESAKNRAITKERARKHREKSNDNTVTKVTHEALPEKRREEVLEEKKERGDVCTLAQALEFARTCVMPPISQDCAQGWHDQMLAIGWQINNMPVADWKAALRRWASKWNTNNQTMRTNQKPTLHKGIYEKIEVKRL